MFHPKVQFSPRRTKSIGLTDGKGVVKQFWAYLRQFLSITKEMSVDKRNDFLTDAALHYGEHSGFEINGHPVVRDDQNLTLTTKSLNMVAPWTTKTESVR